ncbi:MAG: hypothetical protein ACOY42_08900 [Pseudomonadota bacterium]
MPAAPALRRAAGAAAGALPTTLATAAALALFALFLELHGVSAAQALGLMWRGAFGSPFALANTLQRAAPLMLTALCVLLPARAGLIVIGGEGTLALGGLAAGTLAIVAPGLPAALALPLMALAAMLAGWLVIGACAAGGAAAGLAGMFEVAAVQGSANASLLSGYGTAGILVAFAAHQNPLAVILCAVLVGGIGASGSLLQRRLDLPDAATLVLQGLIFANLLAWEALQGRVGTWRLRLGPSAEPRHG